jgi:surfeit locus 1 family protein
VSLFFSRKWIVATLLVLAAAGVMVRLGAWQLDRLEQRRALNARVEAQINAERLDLNAFLTNAPSPSTEKLAELEGMAYRTVVARGTFDPSNEVALRNQVYQDNQIGVHLLTPMKLSGTDQAIVVDRGWIPLEDFSAGRTSQYQETGEVTLQGRLLRSVETGTIWQKADPTPAPGQRLDALIYPNLSRIAAQSDYSLLTVYVEASPSPEHTGLPYRVNEPVYLTEGSHMNYAIQWFAFAAILLAGYPIYVRRSERGEKKPVKSISQTPAGGQPPVQQH